MEWPKCCSMLLCTWSGRVRGRPDLQAYVNNSLLEIEFEHPSNDVTILIINSTTGETVYYEKTTSFEKIKFINLDKHYKTTEYTLKVSSPLWVAVGVISIE